jgi:hypothetical protein
MATTTPNFGWSVPTSTDLVKDGATAIETLGDSIDASLVDLKGGTTGQVLAKNSNTDMDFVWSNDAAGMTNPMTTTGDIIYSSSGSTPARLGIGTTGQVLNVSGGVPAWATPAAPSSGFNLIEAGTITNAATFNFGAVFSATYRNYKIIIEGRSGTGRPQLSGLMRVSGTNDSGANYHFAADGRNRANTQIGWAGNASSAFNLGLTNDSRYAIDLDVINPNVAIETMVTGTLVAIAPSQTDFGYVTFGGHYLDSTVFDSMGFSMASSDFTGTYRVYGLAN